MEVGGGCGCAAARLALALALASGTARVELHADEARGREKLGCCNVALEGRRVGRVRILLFFQMEMEMAAAWGFPQP